MVPTREKLFIYIISNLYLNIPMLPIHLYCIYAEILEILLYNKKYKIFIIL